MKINILPGDQLTMRMKERGVEKSFPVAVIALIVHRTSIVVVEFKSQNGLGRIRGNGDSAKGKYWYEYRDQDSNDQVLDVTWLERSSGEHIYGLFIEE